jgi:hypothetical protein
MAAENLAPTGIWSPDRPARSESLYRLCHPGPPTSWEASYNSKSSNESIATGLTKICGSVHTFPLYNPHLTPTPPSLIRLNSQSPTAKNHFGQCL